MKTNCIVVDDDPVSLELIKSYLDNFEDFKVTGEANNAIHALKLIDIITPDLIFLDINLPDISGIELIKSLVSPPEVIFVSGSSDYAIEGFELNIIDYLLKPISFERFVKALNKYKCRISEQSRRTNSTVKSIKITTGNKVYYLNVDDIEYIESMREFVKIHLVNKETLIVKYVLRKLEEILPKDIFIRVHKSYIVSVNKIKSLSMKQIEIADRFIPIGLTYKNSTLKTIK